MSAPYAIIDIDFLSQVEALDIGWGVWECEALLEDGGRMPGQIQGDGLSHWDLDSFEPDEAYP